MASQSRICKPYLDDNSWDLPTQAPPFTGGQCADTYILNVQRIREDGSVQSDTNRRTRGPIRGARRVALDSGNPPNYSLQIGSHSPLQATANCGATVDEGFAWRQFGSGVGDDIRIVSATPCGANDCGDPPSELEPGPNPAPDPGPIDAPDPTDDPNNPTGPPLVPIPPYDDPIGGPIPITGPEQNPDVVGPDDIPGNPDTSPGGGDDYGDPIAVDPGPAGGGNDTDFGPPPAGRVWVGAALRFTFPPTTGTIAGSGPANPVTPRAAGNASLVFDDLRGDAHVVRSASMVLARPVGALEVTGVYVNCEPGITYTVTPLSLEKCPENSCSGEE